LQQRAPGSPICWGLYQAFSGWIMSRYARHFTGMRYGRPEETGGRDGDLFIWSHFNSDTGEIVSDAGYLKGVLREGAERVTPIANSTVDLVKQRMGLYNRVPDMGHLGAYVRLVRENRNFRRLWLAQIISEIGRLVLRAGCLWPDSRIDRQRQTGGPGGGVASTAPNPDRAHRGRCKRRLRRKHVMIAADLIRMVVVLA